MTSDAVRIAFSTKGPGVPYIEVPPIPFCHGVGPAEIPQWQMWDEVIACRAMLVDDDCRGAGFEHRDRRPARPLQPDDCRARFVSDFGPVELVCSPLPAVVHIRNVSLWLVCDVTCGRGQPIGRVAATCAHNGIVAGVSGDIVHFDKWRIRCCETRTPERRRR